MVYAMSFCDCFIGHESPPMTLTLTMNLTLTLIPTLTLALTVAILLPLPLALHSKLSSSAPPSHGVAHAACPACHAE